MATEDKLKEIRPLSKDEDQREPRFFNRPRAGGKTLWDWLNFLTTLAVPLVIALATVLLSMQQANLAQKQHDADQQRAIDQQQAVILQTYMDNIQDLLLNHQLSAKPSVEVRELARARTLTALRGLDPKRKGVLAQFLYDAGLIGFLDNKDKPQVPIIILTLADLSSAILIGANLSGANLSSAELSGADLSDAYLKGTNLNFAHLHDANLSCAHYVRNVLNCADLSGATMINADLSGATLSDTIFRGATLISASLEGADLERADLEGAHLEGAYLSDADLRDADLRGAILTGTDLGGARITQQQLDQVYSCESAGLPNGLTCHRIPQTG